MSRRRRARAVVERGLGLLLRAYPRRFRQRFGRDVMRDVRTDLSHAADRGWRPLARASLHELRHAAAGIVPEYRLAWLAQRPIPFRQRYLVLLQSLAEEARQAVRSLASAPSFSLTALVILALGIGATTAIFSVVDAVVLRSLPFDEHDRLVAALEYDPTSETTFGSGSTTVQNFLDWRRMQEPFEAITIEAFGRWQVDSPSGEPLDIDGREVSHEFFDVLRVAPLFGRTFVPDDEIRDRHHVIVLSYGLWQRWFGGEPDVLGRTLPLDGEPWEIVGVLPPDFRYPVASADPAELFAPIVLSDVANRETSSRNFNYLTIGRLRPGVSIEQADDQMAALTASLDARYPEWYRGRRARVISLHERLVGSVRTWMLMLLGAVVFVLAIACANVANLMLARAATRTHELGIRAALGASRRRLVRTLLVESLVLAGAGTVLGVLVGAAGVDLLRSWLPSGIPRVADIAVDGRVLATAAAAAVVTGLFFGIVPAIQGSRAPVVGLLSAETRWSTSSRAQQRARSGLVVAEVALATMLLVGAGLFIGSFVRVITVDQGFDYHNLLVLDIGVPYDANDREGTVARGREYVRQALDALRSVPGVAGVGAVNGGVPLTGSWSRSTVRFPGREDELESDLDLRKVSPGYLELLKVPLLAGRPVTVDDRSGAPNVIVVNQMAAERYWPGLDPLGQRIEVNGAERTVVGVVGNIRHLGPESPRRQEAYIPLDQATVFGAGLVVKTTDEPTAILPAVKGAIWQINPEQRLRTEGRPTLEDHMDRLIAQRRFSMALLVVFGGLGLVIAIAGIYGVMAYAVAQRIPEFGVRLALGATPSDVLSMVVRRGLWLVGLGLTLGGIGAWALSGAVRSFLFQIDATDARSFAAALVVLAGAGLLASVLPARRAARVDPAAVLRRS